MKRYARTPVVLQMEATECGAASLSMIFQYFGKYVPLEQMRIETGVSRDGCNMANIMRAAKRHGLMCKGYRKETEALRELPMPCIIHWNFNHFVVLEGFRGKNVYLNDPGVGRRKITYEELDDSFTGVVLTFELTESFVKEGKKQSVIGYVVKRATEQFSVLVELLYIGLLLVFPGLVLPVLSQIFIDDVLGRGYKEWLTRVLVFMGASLLLKVCLMALRTMILTKLQAKMTLLSNHKFLQHMIRLPISFFDQRYTGDLVSRVDNNTQINIFLAGDLAESVLNILTAVFYLAVLLFYSPILTLIGVLNIALSILVAILGNRSIANQTMKLQMAGGKLYGAVCAGLNITDTIKASGAEMEYTNRLEGFQALKDDQEQKIRRFQQVISTVPSALGKLADVLILMVGALLVIRGQFTVGMLVAFNSLFDSFCDPINKLIGFFEKLQNMKSNIMRVNDIERYPQEEVPEVAKDNRKGKLTGQVALKDVSFGYSTLKPPTVEHFDFTLQSGESVAFVGPSGCGKSTVSKVVSGLYHPWTGTVLFDNTPISQISKGVMNASVSTVSQNIMLFSGTVRDNLKMWNPAVLDDDMIRAAKDACIHDFIMKQPGGYNYILDEGAANLSGGQRQRMEIARALATNPSILIMDEATSALDPIVEKEIMDNIHSRGCTCIVVAHRLSTIRDCNQIIVMSKGKIIERGTHESLLKEHGAYYKFVMST